MRGISIRGACRRRLWGGGMGLVVACWLILSPPAARASDVPDYAPAYPQLPIPLGSTRPEDGGLYVFSEFIFFKQPVKLRSEEIARRGFIVSDNSLGIPIGTFVGSGTQASGENAGSRARPPNSKFGCIPHRSAHGCVTKVPPPVSVNKLIRWPVTVTGSS